MLSNNFAQLNQEVFRHVMKMQNITFGCDNKFMCKAYKIKHRLSINYYINDAGAGEDIMNVIRSVKNFIQKIYEPEMLKNIKIPFVLITLGIFFILASLVLQCL